MCGCALLLAGRRRASEKNDAPHAVVAGSGVSRERLLAAGGHGDAGDERGVPRDKKLQAVSDARGEFAFRVPPGAATYVVKASLKGFQAAEKEACGRRARSGWR